MGEQDRGAIAPSNQHMLLMGILYRAEESIQNEVTACKTTRKVEPTRMLLSFSSACSWTPLQLKVQNQDLLYARIY